MVYSLSTAFAIYFVVWWVVLFLTLPFGVRSPHENNDGTAAGTDPGAPVRSLMGRKLIVTTLISAMLFAAGLLAYRADYLNVERLSKLMGIPL